MNEEAAAFAAKVTEELAKHTEEWREDFFGALGYSYCPSCGHEIDNGTCWYCYSSPPENYG